MGNTLGVASDIAVESLAEINQKVEEEKLKSSFQIFEKEMDHLTNLSDRFIVSRKVIPNFLEIKMEGTTIFQKLGNGLILTYNPEKKSAKVVQTCEESQQLDVCYVSKENELFMFWKRYSGFKHFSLTTVDQSEINVGYYRRTLKEICAMCSSVTFHKLNLIHASTGIDDIMGLKQHENNLIVNTKSNDILVIDLKNYEIINKHPHGPVDNRISITNNYICVKREGFSTFYPDEFIYYPTMELISKDERFFLTFDADKWVGKIYPMTLGREEFTKSESEKFDSSFFLLDSVLSFDFSDDSEFLFILENSDLKCNLKAFSIREKKFVFNMKLSHEIRQIFVQNNHVICCASGEDSPNVIEILELCIPKKLKPYLYSSKNLDLFFKFQ
jgi:hypothetical protein